MAEKEPNTLLENAIMTNAHDIRDVRKSVSSLEGKMTDLQSTQQRTDLTLEFFTRTITEVKATVSSLDGQLDNGMKELQQKLDTNNDSANLKMNAIIANSNANQIKGLQEYKNIIVKLGVAVLIAGATTAVGLIFN